MGQIVSSAAKPKRCNLNQLSQVPTPAAGEYILVSSDNSMNAAGQANFDCYIVGDGQKAATALELKSLYTKPSYKKLLDVNTFSLTSCGGTIRSSDKKWLSNNQYYGALIEVNDYGYVEIAGNNTNASSYTFLKTGFQNGVVADFATGYNSTINIPVGEKVMLQIPSDAVYLYVYLKSQNTSFVPREIGFGNMFYYNLLSEEDVVNSLEEGGATKPLSAEAGKALYDDISERYDYDTELLSSCGGAISDSTNKWSNASGYYGALIDVTNIRGISLTITPNGNGNEFTYTFLKSGFSNGSTPDYCDGYSHTIKSYNEVSVVVPQDAVYLYVYLNSNGVIYTPSAIYYKKLIKSYVVEHEAELNEINGLYLDASTLYQGSTYNNNGKDAADNACVRTFYIPIGDKTSIECLNMIIPSDGYTLEFKHTFYSSSKQFVSVSAWSGNANVVVPSGALGGYDRIVVRRKNGDTTISSTTPQDIVPYKLAFNIYGIVGLKEQIVSAQKDNNSRIMAGLAPRQITICSWNIGHFSLGAQKNSTITSSNYDTKLSAFRELIYDTINPRLIGLCEYSKVFGSNANGAQNANKVLFNDLAVVYEGNQYNYSCNALYSNTYLSNIELCQYECLQNESITHTSAIAATDYYYLQADLYLEGRFVKLVMTHLAFDNNRPSVLQVAQINELVQKMASYDRVILMGDWNVYSQSDFDAFVSAGYTLGNNGSIITYPSSNKALDNIIVKGVTMNNFAAVQSALSDHYPVVATISV